MQELFNEWKLNHTNIFQCDKNKIHRKPAVLFDIVVIIVWHVN